MQRLTTGDAKVEEIDMIEELTYQLDGRSICALGDAAAWPIQGSSAPSSRESTRLACVLNATISMLGLIRHFRPLMEQRIADYAAKKGPHLVNTDVVTAAESMYATK